jgi:hypothetical protein
MHAMAGADWSAGVESSPAEAFSLTRETSKQKI